MSSANHLDPIARPLATIVGHTKLRWCVENFISRLSNYSSYSLPLPHLPHTVPSIVHGAALNRRTNRSDILVQRSLQLPQSAVATSAEAEAIERAATARHSQVHWQEIENNSFVCFIAAPTEWTADVAEHNRVIVPSEWCCCEYVLVITWFGGKQCIAPFEWTAEQVKPSMWNVVLVLQ